MKFKVGDKVRVREDLVGNRRYSGVHCNYDMASMRGQILTITDVILTIIGSKKCYKVQENVYFWTNTMLESIKEENEMEENNNKVICHCCGEEIEEQNAIEFDGVYFCSNECLNRETDVCDRCGHREWNEDTISCMGDILCDSCADNYTTFCDDCEERIYLDYAITDGNTTLCERCYDDNYRRCVHCDRIVYDDDVYWDEDNDPCCEECYNRHNKFIKNYGYKPEPIFYGEGKRFFGVELEIDDGGEEQSNAETLLDIGNEDGEHIYIKSDGSLDEGMEIVSHPMTLDYHKDYCWSEIMKKAVSMDYRSHQTSTCGLHIHVNRNSLGSTTEEQDETIAKILYLVEAYWNEMVKFSRRSESKINEWAARYGYEREPKKILDKAKNSGRYAAVNLCNYKTIEFRLFRGTLKHNTFIATLQLVDKICELACTRSETDIEAMSWLDFVSTIEEPELIQYLKERNLYVNETINSEEEV
jgi:hypothetical protein